jgi:large subunit ribosomal protein L15
MKLTEIRDNEGAHKSRIRVGRGIGSGKGKTGGRGVKGQKARSGVAVKRGFHNLFSKDLNEVNLGRIQQAVEAGKLDTKGTVTIEALVTAGVITRQAKDGVKILGVGELTTKLAFEVAGASKSAVEAIEKAGGSVKILATASQA